MTRRFAVVTLMALLACACGDQTSPSAPTTTTTSVAVTETFAGTLAVGGSRFYSFRVSTDGTVNLMLASVASPANGSALSNALEIGVGIPQGTGCAVTTSQVLTPALTSQMSTSRSAGTHCVRVADIGDLRSAVTFAVRFTHP